MTWKIHLRNMSDGAPHPAARRPTLSYTFALSRFGGPETKEMAVTSSRLVVLRATGRTDEAQVVVWDWRTGQVLMELKHEYHSSVAFLDNYWLAFVLDSRKPDTASRLVLMNTKLATDEVVPTQTTFRLHQDYLCLVKIRLYVEQGGDEPSHEDSFAPFYPDPSQRVFSICLDHDYEQIFLVMKTEVLLKLAREQPGMEMEWEQLESHTFTVQPGNVVASWVSGHRLFCISCGGLGDNVRVVVHDFSAQASARGQKTWDEWRHDWLGAQDLLSWDHIRWAGGSREGITILVGSEWIIAGVSGAGTLHTWIF